MTRANMLEHLVDGTRDASPLVCKPILLSMVTVLQYLSRLPSTISRLTCYADRNVARDHGHQSTSGSAFSYSLRYYSCRTRAAGSGQIAGRGPRAAGGIGRARWHPDLRQ